MSCALSGYLQKLWLNKNAVSKMRNEDFLKGCHVEVVCVIFSFYNLTAFKF